MITDDTLAADAHLTSLRHQIDDARSELQALQRAADAARKDRRTDKMQQVLLDNQRLLAESIRASRQAEAANAALRDAIAAAETDPLTRLPNRIVLHARLDHDIAVARRHHTQLAVYFLDLDGFKTVNDCFGHDMGDRLLKHVAACLLSTVRASDTVCRLGGDEFVLVVPDIRTSDVDAFARKICEAVRSPCALAGRTVCACASIGASMFPADGDDPDTLIRKADEGMYRAKRAAVGDA